jgi:hypothetical protein
LEALATPLWAHVGSLTTQMLISWP